MRTALGLVLLLLCLIFAATAYAESGDGLKRLTLKRAFTKPSLRGAIPGSYAWSRDDTHLAYLWNADGWSFNEVWVMDVESGERWRVTNLEPAAIAEAFEANREIEDEDERKTDEEILDDVRRSRGVGAPVWGPDGMLYISWKGDIWRIPPDAPAVNAQGEAQFAEPELFLDFEGHIGGFRFSEDGAMHAFTHDNTFWVGDIRSGSLREAAQGAAGLSQSQWAWSPDNRYIAFVRTDSSGIRKVNVVDFIAENVSTWGVDRPRPGDTMERNTVGIVDLERIGHKRHEARMLKLADTDEVYINDIFWSPAGEYLLIAMLSKDTRDYSLCIAEPDTGRTALVWREHDDAWYNSRGRPRWLGDSAVVFPSERDGYNHLYRLDISSWEFPPEIEEPTEEVAAEESAKEDGENDEEAEEAPPDGYNKPFEPELPEPVQLTRGEWEILRAYIPRGESAIYFVSSELGPDRRNLYLMSPDGANVRRLTTGTGVNGFASWWVERGSDISWGEGKAIVSSSRAVRGPSHYILDLATGARGPVIHSEHPSDFYAYRWIEPEFVRIESETDGELISARVYRPPYAKPGELRPLVLRVHGAGYAQSARRRFEWTDPVSMYLADTLGYIVADVDYRGSSGYGRKWRVDVHHRLGELEVADCVSVVHHFVNTGEADPERVGIWGWSYGGFLTNMAMFLAPETFQAGVSVAAVNDWANYHTWFSSQRLGDPAENADAYKRSNPIEHFEKLEGHLLMIHGIRDDNVFFQDFAQLVAKMSDAGKHFDVMVYPETGHGPSGDENMVHIAETVCGYFQRYFGLGVGASGPRPEDTLAWEKPDAA